MPSLDGDYNAQKAAIFNIYNYLQYSLLVSKPRNPMQVSLKNGTP